MLNFKIFLGSVIALMLGIAMASPILVPNLKLTTKIQMEVEVVYAYFGIQDFDKQVVGLWRNSSSVYEYNLHMVSYSIVLNITNPSDKLALIEEFEAAAAQEISIDQGLGVAIQNRIVGDFRDMREYYPGWSQYISHNTSRLIAITGIAEVSNVAAYDALSSGSTSIFGRVQGHPFGDGTSSTAFSLKQVQLQRIGNDFLYNAILSENQMWRMDTNGIDVYIETRR